ncbi:MAG TPA: winged helix-turn-helix domain-containing protein [Steroidobacteraceae bacterium]|nr:winged helix-turn-helix domain-containing protein [Steroidobacteraceae bacterium]
MATESAASVRFGAGFELDARAWELRHDGVPVRLERIPMQILLFMAEQHGQLVTREALVERIWGKSAFLDTDNSINGAIRKIRAALHDDSENPQFIQTVTGCGYRFIAPVTPLVPAPVTPAVAPHAARPPPLTAPAGADSPAARSSAKWWAIGALAVAALGGEIAWFLHFSHPGSPARPHEVMLAVLPLANMTGDPSQEYFSDGLTEELIAQLGNADPKRLGVIARTSVMRYKNSHEDVGQIARELQAQYVLEGSVRRDDGSVRVTAQLVRASDQAHVWAQQYDRTMTSVLTVQSEIARRIAEEIRGTIGEPVPAAVATAAKVAQAAVPARPAASELYQQGRYFWNKRSAAGFQRALVYFQRAIDEDARFAPAHAGLADTYLTMSKYGLAPPRQLMPRARTAALRALELDANSAEGHSALGSIAQDFDYDWKSAEREYRRALELNPNYATAHQWYAEYLAAQGHFPEALAESERALTLDPQSIVMRADHAALLYFARQPARALDAFRAVLAMDPANRRAYLMIQPLVQQGHFADALTQLAEWRRIDPNPWQSAAEAYVYGRAGDATRASAALEEMERANTDKGWDALPMRALAYLGLGDKERLLDTLETAYTERASFITLLSVDPAYDSVRDEPRFQNLLQRVGTR